MTTWLSPHFSLDELIATQHRQFENWPPPPVQSVLRQVAGRMEAVRALLGDTPITISSGYRNPQVNRAVGGALHSAHLTGHAVDFNCYGFGDPIEVCRAISKSNIGFDQLVEEGSWVHLSFDPRMRGQVLTKVPNGYAPGLAA